MSATETEAPAREIIAEAGAYAVERIGRGQYVMLKRSPSGWQRLRIVPTSRAQALGFLQKFEPRASHRFLLDEQRRKNHGGQVDP